MRGALSELELAAARAAFERTLSTAVVPPPGGVRDRSTGPARSNIDGKPIREPDLECLATHPKLLPILNELGNGAPQLTAMTMVYHPPHTGPPLTTEMYGQIHSHREGSPPDSGRICYQVRTPGRVYTDDLNVFPYFTTTQPGDGGLAVVPGKLHCYIVFVCNLQLTRNVTTGSHKSMFSRPRSLFWPYSNSGENPLFGCVYTPDRAAPSLSHVDDWPESSAQLQQRLISTDAAGNCQLHAPDGLVQLALEAGDFVIMSEMCSHCIIPWQPTDRSRQALTLRFYSGNARTARGGVIDADLEDWIEHVAPSTRALLKGVPLEPTSTASL